MAAPLFIPPQKTFLFMGTAFVTVMFSMLMSYDHGFITQFPYLLIYVWDMWFHEFGHAITGWLFGYFSIPVPMFTMNLARSWILQIIMLVALVIACAIIARKRPEYLAYAIFLTILVFVLAMTPYTGLLILYMGHGGAMLWGGFFQYRGWTYNRPGTAGRHWFICWLGYALTLRNVFFGYDLATSEEARQKYHAPAAFGADNDFIRIVDLLPSLDLQKIGVFTMCLGIAIIFASFILALFSNINNARRFAV